MNDTLLLLIARLYRQASRCAMYALRAEKDGQPAMALYFQALATSHDRQAHRFLLQARGVIDNTKENLATVSQEELPGFMETYEALQQQAMEEGKKGLATGCRQSSGIERMNSNLGQRVDEQKEGQKYYVCNFCGFVSPDKAPLSCPICTAPQTRFLAIERPPR